MFVHVTVEDLAWDDLLDLAVAASLPPPIHRLLAVNYIKGSSRRVNDVPLSCNKVNTHPLCVCVRVKGGV